MEEQLILPRLNAFVVLMLPPPSDDTFVEGRVKAMNGTTLFIITGPMQVDEIRCPPWRLMHCHHQPVKERVKIDGDFVWVDGADDSPAWRKTREMIASAMIRMKRTPPRPPKELA